LRATNLEQFFSHFSEKIFYCDWIMKVKLFQKYFLSTI
jgi:hypothetical protein